MRYRAIITVNQIIKFLVAVTIFLSVMGLFIVYLKWGRGYLNAFGMVPLWDLDGEGNIPAIFSVFLIALNGFLLSVIAKHPDKPIGTAHYWKVLSYVFYYLSIDELIGLHERVGLLVYRFRPDLINATENRYWILPMGALLVLLSIYMLRLYVNLPLKVKWRFAYSCSIYLLGAVGVEYLGDLFYQYSGEFNLGYGLLYCVEETLEMLGMILFSRTLLSYLLYLSGNKNFQLEVQL